MCETYRLKATGLSNTVVNHLKLYGYPYGKGVTISICIVINRLYHP